MRILFTQPLLKSTTNYLDHRMGRFWLYAINFVFCIVCLAGFMDTTQGPAHIDRGHVHICQRPTFLHQIPSRIQRMDDAHQVGAGPRRWYLRMPSIHTADT